MCYMLLLLLSVNTIMAQNFGPAEPLVTRNANITTFDLAGPEEMISATEPSFLCWIEYAGASSTLYVQQLGPENTLPKLITQDFTIKARCRISILTDDSIRVWWQEKEDSIWRICFRDMGQLGIAPKDTAIENLSSDPQMTATDSYVAWLADSLIHYWGFNNAEAGPQELDFGERVKSFDLNAYLNFLAVIEKDSLNQLIWLEGGGGEDPLWIVHDLEKPAIVANPHCGRIGAVAWQYKADSVWQIVSASSIYSISRDTTSNQSCNYCNPTYFMYNQETKAAFESTPFFVAYDSDSLKDNREIWINAYDVRHGSKSSLNISNSPGNDHHPQVALVSENGTASGVSGLAQRN